MVEWQRANPLAKFDKTRSWVNTDSYIDEAVRGVLGTNKMLEQPNPNIKDILVLRIANVDLLETVMLGLGKVQLGQDENDVPFPYQKEIDAVKEKIKSFSGDEQKVKFANAKFQLLLSALQRSKPMTVELSG